MKMQVAVTGVNGFVGKHLVAELVSAGCEVIGVGNQTETRVEGIKEYFSQDLSQGWPHGLEADAIVHLAGLSAVGPSFSEPQRYINENSAMVTHMCESILAHDSPVRLLVISSGAVYDAHQKQPIAESGELSFNSPYVVSKILVENQIAYYNRRGMDAIIARPFNHIGPGQASGFLVPDLYQAVTAAAETEGRINVGNLDTRRDYTDVRDVVRAYRLLLEATDLSDRVFNVCSGRSRSGRELLDRLVALGSSCPLDVQVDHSVLRPGDPPKIVGSYERLRKAVDWSPQIPFVQSLTDFAAAAHVR